MLILGRVLGCLPIISKSTSEEVLLALDHTFYSACFLVPDVDASTEGSCQDIVCVWMESNVQDLRIMLEAVDLAILAKHIPHSDGLVPRPTHKQTVRGTEAERCHWPCVSRHYVHQLSSFKTPYEYIERITRASTDNIATSLNCKTHQLSMLVGSHSPEILVSYQVKRSDCTIYRRAQNSVSFLGHELYVCNFSFMVSKSRETQTILSRPTLKFAVVSTCSQINAIRRIRKTIHIEKVALLLEHI